MQPLAATSVKTLQTNQESLIQYMMMWIGLQNSGQETRHTGNPSCYSLSVFTCRVKSGESVTDGQKHEERQEKLNQKSAAQSEKIFEFSFSAQTCLWKYD